MAETQTTPVDLGVSERTIEDRMQAFVNNEPTLTEDEPAAEPQEAAQEAPEEQDEEGLSAADLPDDEPAPGPSEGETWEIVHNGQQVKLTREEVIRNAQQGFDYTKKTQEVAAQRAEAQAVLQRAAMVEQMMPHLAQELATVKAFETQLKQYGTVDWVALATNDPLEYPKYRAQYDQLVTAYQGAAQQYQHKAQAVLQERHNVAAYQLQQEHQTLTERIPEWRDPVKYQTGAQELRQYLIKEGANPVEVDSLTSAVAVSIARKAMLYDKLKEAKASKSKQVRAAAPMPKPGAPGSAQADKALQARQRLAKSGRREDAVGLLLARMK